MEDLICLLATVRTLEFLVIEYLMKLLFNIDMNIYYHTYLIEVFRKFTQS